MPERRLKVFIWIARMFGFCGHEMKWEPSEFKSVDGEKVRVQMGHCARCGLLKMRTVVVA